MVYVVILTEAQWPPVSEDECLVEMCQHSFVIVLLISARVFCHSGIVIIQILPSELLMRRYDFVVLLHQAHIVNSEILFQPQSLLLSSKEYIVGFSTIRG
jgi:hypothetical protein